ncbi:MAG: hypothetical protein AB7K14_08525 [Lysobacterales bacterium]
MSIPKSLLGDGWTPTTARHALPIVIAAAQHGRCITYGEIDGEIVTRKLGHHVLAVKYGHPAGAIGNAMIELGERWGEDIPPLNAIIVNAKDGMPGDGVNSYLKRYFNSKTGARSYTIKQRRAIVEEIQADVFAFKHWNRVLAACNAKKTSPPPKKKPRGKIQPPVKGGWSNEPESEEHKKLKEHVARNPALVGLPKSTAKGHIEYRFASADCADVVFTTADSLVGVEVKSRISNEPDLTRGVFQAIKYQALLRAEQKSRGEPPTATAVLVSEQPLSEKLRYLAEILRIEVFVVL